MTEYRLRSKLIRQVPLTACSLSWPSKGESTGCRRGFSASQAWPTVSPLWSGWACSSAQRLHSASSQPFSSSRLAKRSLGWKKRPRITLTWFSTCPFSQPDAGVQAVGSTM